MDAIQIAQKILDTRSNSGWWASAKHRVLLASHLSDGSVVAVVSCKGRFSSSLFSRVPSWGARPKLHVWCGSYAMPPKVLAVGTVESCMAAYMRMVAQEAGE